MVLMTRRLIRGAIKTVAGIAVLVFLLARMRTETGLILFIGAIVVLLVCFGLLKFLEDDDDNTRYWPPNPKT
jgi:O-antigen ligase